MYFTEMFRSCTILKHNSAINISESIEKSGSRYRRPNVNWTSEHVYIYVYTSICSFMSILNNFLASNMNGWGCRFFSTLFNIPIYILFVLIGFLNI